MNDDDLKNSDPFLDGDNNGREITIGVESSLNLPPMETLIKDRDQLQNQADHRRDRIRGYRREIKKKEAEKAELLDLVEDPGFYDPVACKKNAERCDQHIKMFEATIEKERAGVEQLESMIKTINDRICLKEQTSQ